ncbi:hypothetical protein FHG87_000266 [Trinorchestia longiramus]|nr:hypothetical protein FHG87_000266 [Trinorchestia longiramus]
MSDDRPASSSSCRSSSRIPRLSRSTSLRGVRPSVGGGGHRRAGSVSVHEAPVLSRNNKDKSEIITNQEREEMVERPAALFRSASFISSRGTNGLLSPSPHSSLSPISPHSPASPQSFLSLPFTPQYGSRPRHSTRPLSFPMTPELPRRRFSYVSPYSVSYIASERRAKVSCLVPTLSHYLPVSLPPCLVTSLSHYLPVSLPPCLITSLSHYLPVSLPPCLVPTLSHYHPVSFPPCLIATLSRSHPVSLPPCLVPTLSRSHPVSLPPCLITTVSRSHPVSLPSCLITTLLRYHIVSLLYCFGYAKCPKCPRIWKPRSFD